MAAPIKRVYEPRLSDYQVKMVTDYARMRGYDQPSTNGETIYCTISMGDLAAELNAMQAHAAGKVFTEINCTRAWKKEFGPQRLPPKPKAQPQPEAAAPAVPEPADLGIPVMDAADAAVIRQIVANGTDPITQSLQEHRANTADTLAEIQKQLDEVLGVTRRLAEVWNIAK